MNAGAWLEPPWGAPLDGDAHARLVPLSATMSGLFLDGAASVARAQGLTPSTARPSYVHYRTYPLREHCELLVDVARLAFPDLPLRQGLRKLGRGAPSVLIRSPIGRVALENAEGPLAAIRAMATSYALHMRPGRLEIEADGERAAIVRLSNVYNFVDSHNVGVFEGILKYAGVRGSIKIRSISATAADLLCSW